MKKTLSLLNAGFESSSQTTPEFLKFFKTFKKEFKEELESVGARDIVFSKGHFYVSGFFTTNIGGIYYFSLSDVRDSWNKELLYRTATSYKDFTGGSNRYVTIKKGMAQEMDIL